MHSRIVLSVCAALAPLGAAGCHPKPPRGAFLYEVTCEARVEKFDTGSAQRVGDYALAQRSGQPPRIPVTPGPVEVCLANRPTFDATGSILYVLAPSTGKATEEPIDYALLGFSVPALSLVSHAPAATGVDHPPQLVPVAGAPPRVVLASAWTPPSEALASFAPDHRDVFNEVLARSGHRTLVRLTLPPDGHDALAVADEATHVLVRLQSGAVPSREYVHLSPGGTHVVVEEASASGPRASKTGTLRVYSAETGRALKTLSDERIRSFHWRGASPAGVALFQHDDQAWFLDLGVAFGVDQVETTTVDDFPLPAVFFADQ